MQYVPRNGARKGPEMKRDYTNSEVISLIGERIHKLRDREILVDRFVNGLTFEQLAEAHNLSVRQVKNIVYKGSEIIFK